MSQAIDQTLSGQQVFRYQSLENRVDEAISSEGEIKPHWSYLLNSLEELGHDEFLLRQQRALRILRDDGASYNIYGDSRSGGQAQNHVWNLDLIPNVISSSEWADIEAGLLERAELFNLLLRDIYGARSLIRTGVLPPEALFGHRGFLRACHGIQLPGEHDLILHAVDMMRSSDGSMLVLGDRTQSPSGSGYALENRSVMSRVFPSLFRDSHVHRLASFYHRLRAKLTSLSPNQSQPRVAVLTPGPHNETYFEHAFLASYMGFHLVQSDDLMVRNGFVWMKSLDGLSRVDVLLRRVDDSYCDPVELRADSRLGVPGLLEVVRAGNVVVANPLGSGVLENPVLLRYLPAISKALIGRELRLPSVETYWCGEEQDLQFVLDHFNDLVIKPVFRGAEVRSIHTLGLSEAEREELRQRILAEPTQFVAQPATIAGVVPTFSDDGLVSRPSILRSFAVAGETSYALLPGGLTRVGRDLDSFIISSQAGALSKDTWVIASEPELQLGLESLEDNATVKESDLISLPSRVVENLFWMGRYAERAEASLRVLRTTFMLYNSDELISNEIKTQLLEAVSSVLIMPKIDAEGQSPEQRLQTMVANGLVFNSISASLNAMLNCAEQTKELLSSDTYRVINDIRDALVELQSALAGSFWSAPEEALDPLVTTLMAFSGLTQESMSRGFGWRFMEMGRRLERASQIAKGVRLFLVPAFIETDQHKLSEALLLTLEALITYRRRYRAAQSVANSLDLVLLDSSNPRSLIYQIDALNEHVKALPRPNAHSNELSAEERRLVSCEAQIKLASLNSLSDAKEGKREKLDALLQKMEQNLLQISDMITDKYFDHREVSQQLVHSSWEDGE